MGFRVKGLGLKGGGFRFELHARLSFAVDGFLLRVPEITLVYGFLTVFPNQFRTSRFPDGVLNELCRCTFDLGFVRGRDLIRRIGVR